MRILSLNPGHDGNIACITDGVLEFSLEAEKNSFPRYSYLTANVVARALTLASGPLDVICLSGWPTPDRLNSAYVHREDAPFVSHEVQILGEKNRVLFSSSHERAHIMQLYGMSPYPQGMPVYVLIVEGTLGNFYSVDRDLNISLEAVLIPLIGQKYSFLYYLGANQQQEVDGRGSGVAGKLMALAGFAKSEDDFQHADDVINKILEIKYDKEFHKSEFEKSPYYRIGIESQEFKNLAGRMTDVVFDRFREGVLPHVKDKRPLLIGGGCGLNCDWNSRWNETGIFADVFVPPCCNDSGISIGTALDAQWRLTQNAKLSWNVYAGERFDMDQVIPDHLYEKTPLDYDHLASLLAEDRIFALVQGRYEMGPRALGNRSLIASPLNQENHRRLNAIKLREQYRPIAPLCLEEDCNTYFEGRCPSPWMLFFHRLKTPNLPAITHVDGTARVQTVNEAENPRAYKILKHFKKRTGYGVLCNTSLNLAGRGFINQSSSLIYYQRERGLDGFIIDDTLYLAREVKRLLT